MKKPKLQLIQKIFLCGWLLFFIGSGESGQIVASCPAVYTAGIQIMISTQRFSLSDDRYVLTIPCQGSSALSG